MDSTVVGLFRNYPRTQGSEFVFTNAAGGRLGWVQNGFRKALARAGLSDLHFHDLHLFDYSRRRFLEDSSSRAQKPEET
jgi:hypothetical protein